MTDNPDGLRRKLVAGMAMSPFLTIGSVGASEAFADSSVLESDEAWAKHWFFRERIQIHTRLAFEQRNTEPFIRWAEYMSELGVVVYTRHIKSAGEAAWWQSAVGESIDSGVVEKLVKDATLREQRIIGYYRHIEDSWVEKNQSDWLCRDAGGQPVRSTRGFYVCLNSPYRDFLFTRFGEAIRIGVSGIYLDKDHMPPAGCWCQYCREKFRSLKLGGFPAIANPSDNAWLRMNEMINSSVASFMEEARRRIHDINGDSVLIASAGPVPMMISRHLDLRTIAAADSSKSEFAASGRVPKVAESLRCEPLSDLRSDVQQSFGFAAVRDGAAGRPAHIWIPKLTHSSDIEMAVAGVISHGCIANLDIEPSSWNATKKDIGSAIQRLRPLADSMAQAVPYRAAAIVIPLGRGEASAKQTAEWLGRAYKAYGKALELRCPIRLLSELDVDTAYGRSFSFLLVPSVDALSATARRSLSDQASGGRNVMEIQAGGNRLRKYAEAGERSLADVLAAPSDFSVAGNEPDIQAHYYLDDAGAPMVCICRRFIQVAELTKGRKPRASVLPQNTLELPISWVPGARGTISSAKSSAGFAGKVSERRRSSAKFSGTAIAISLI